MDVFQTTVTTLALAATITEFIRQYRNAPKAGREILDRIQQTCNVLNTVKPSLEHRASPTDEEEVNVIAQVERSVKICHEILTKVKEVLEKYLVSDKPISLGRAKLVFRRKDLVELQNDLSSHVNIVQLLLSILTTLDNARTKAGVASLARGQTRILQALGLQIHASEDNLVSLLKQSQIADDEGEPPEKGDGKVALAQHVENTRTGHEYNVLGEWIKRARSVHESIQNHAEPDDRSSRDDEDPPESLPIYTPSRTPSPGGKPSPPLESITSADTLGQSFHPDASTHHSDDELEKFIFLYKTKAADEERASNLNQAESALRQAITYAEQLERRTTTGGERQSRQLQEQLSSIFQKQGKWQEAISTLSALLTSDPSGDDEGTGEKGSSERDWHNQRLSAVYFSKVWDDADDGADSTVFDLEWATSYALKAYQSRKQRSDIAQLPQEEFERQRKCIELLINIYRRRNLVVEADTFAEKLSEMSDVTRYQSHSDHGGPQYSARKREERQRRILQAIVERDAEEMHLCAPYETADIEDLSEEQTIVLLFNGVKYSDKDLVELLLTQGTGDSLPNAIDSEKKNRRISGLHIAARHKDVESLHIINSFLKHDADIDAQDRDGHTPIAKAVKSNNIDAVKMLLGRGANKELVDRDDWCLIHHAVRLDDTSVLKLLLKEAAALVHFKDQVEDSALHHAVRQERADHVQCMLEVSKDLEINASNTAGYYPLYLAASHPLNDRRHKVFELLVRHGAKPDPDNPPPRFQEYQSLTRARRLSDISTATTVTSNSVRSDDRSPPRSGFFKRVLTAGSART